jgi:PAS domain S-box-containing protein
MGISEDITERKEATARAGALHQISDLVTRTAGLKELCQAVHHIVKDLMPADNFSVAMHDEHRGELWFPYFVDARDASPGRRPVARGLADYVLHTGRVFFADRPEALAAPAAEGYAPIGPAPMQWMGVPLLVGERCIGVVAVQAYDERTRYEMRHLDTLVLVSRQLANAAAYKQSEEHLRQTAQQLLEAQRLAGLGTWEYDASTRELGWSEEAFRIAGFPPAEEAPRYDEFVASVHPDDRAALEGALQQAVAESRDVQLQIRHLRADGCVTYAMVVGHPVVKDGRTAKLFGTVLDITDRKRAEQELKDRFEQVDRLNRGMMNLLEDLQSANEHLRFTTRQLEAANAELEAFSYSVSHDLRAPLRAIDGFAQALVEDHAGHLTEEGRRCVEKVGENARDMGRLIDGLLEFARLGRQSLAPEALDMTRLVRSVWHDLVGSKGTAVAELRLQELPGAVGDALLLHQVWVNLLSNAIKFTRPVAHPVVEVGCTLDGAQAVYYVRDNGVGFDMKYADKLFGVFQRLHSPGEFEGTGLGTALVQRIVQRHGGRVWAEAQVNRGATFYFSLPRKEMPA